jgi:hypothetical protein
MSLSPILSVSDCSALLSKPKFTSQIRTSQGHVKLVLCFVTGKLNVPDVKPEGVVSFNRVCIEVIGLDRIED